MIKNGLQSKYFKIKSTILCSTLLTFYLVALGIIISKSQHINIFEMVILEINPQLELPPMVRQIFTNLDI